MASTIKIGSAQIRDEDYAIQANAILGIRGTGKTTLAKGIAEQLLDARIPPVVFDPTGVWRHLRRSATKGGKGYPIVVAGGVEPDLELTPATAPLIMRSAITENIPIVFDLYDKKLSKAAWRTIVRECFRVLHYENKGVRHIFLEEAAEFVPQRILDGETYAEIEKIVRMGGNQSIGITLINQRSQEVNKAVLEMCENLVLMKQRGSHAIDALSKWIDRVTPAMSTEITNSMPNMDAGEAWVFRGDENDVKRVQAGKIKTYHPDRRRPELAKRAGKIANVGAFVERLQSQLKTPVVAETVESLRAEVKRLTKELGKKAPAAAKETRTYASWRERHNKLRENLKAVAKERSGLRTQNHLLRRRLASINKISVTPDELNETNVEALLTELKPILQPGGPGRVTGAPRPAQFAKVLGPQMKKLARDAIDVKLGKGHRKVLTVLAQYDGADETQIAIITGYKATTRYQTLKELRAAGYAKRDGDKWLPTQEGLDVLGDYAQLPTGRALIDYWYRTLGAGGSKIFSVIVDAYPEYVHKSTIAEQTGYKTTTTYQTLKELRARKLITLDNGNAMAASYLFE
jgi:DNA-binding MarR family transcriptional regulator